MAAGTVLRQTYTHAHTHSHTHTQHLACSWYSGPIHERISGRKIGRRAGTAETQGEGKPRADRILGISTEGQHGESVSPPTCQAPGSQSQVETVLCLAWSDAVDIRSCMPFQPYNPLCHTDCASSWQGLT